MARVLHVMLLAVVVVCLSGLAISATEDGVRCLSPGEMLTTKGGAPLPACTHRLIHEPCNQETCDPECNPATECGSCSNWAQGNTYCDEVEARYAHVWQCVDGNPVAFGCGLFASDSACEVDTSELDNCRCMVFVYGPTDCARVTPFAYREDCGLSLVGN